MTGAPQRRPGIAAACLAAALILLPAAVSAHQPKDFPATRADRVLAAFLHYHVLAHEALRRCSPVVDRKDIVKPDSLIKIVTYDISYMWSNVRSILGPGRDPKRNPKVLAVRVYYAQAVEAARVQLGKSFDGAPMTVLPRLCNTQRRALLRQLPRFERMHKVIVNGVAQ